MKCKICAKGTINTMEDRGNQAPWCGDSVCADKIKAFLSTLEASHFDYSKRISSPSAYAKNSSRWADIYGTLPPEARAQVPRDQRPF